MDYNTENNDIREYRTKSLTSKDTNTMMREFEKKGWKVLSVNWNSKEGCYVIKYST